MSGLSKHDSGVLAALFDPEAGVRAGHSPTANDTQESVSSPRDADPVYEELQRAEWAAIEPLQSSTATGQALAEAEHKLSEIIAGHPDYASAYVNRAQTRRLRAGVEAADACIFDDLSRAISLASSQQTPRQPATASRRTLAAAHTHRGFVLADAAARRSNGAGGHATPVNALPATLRDSSADTLNELAYHDFAQGARHGDELARAMATRTNPYAKMCGAIVKEALREETGAWAQRLDASPEMVLATNTTRS